MLFLVLGLFIGVCSGYFGIGGGLVGIPALYYIFSTFGLSEAMHVAIGTSVTAMLGSTSLSFLSHRKLTKLHTPVLLWVAPAAFIGAFLGTYTGLDVPERILKLLLSFFEILAGLRMFFMLSKDSQQLLLKPAYLAPGGLVIGFFSSLLGLGGGVLTVPFLSSLGVPHKSAVGNGSLVSFVIIATTATAHFFANYGPGVSPGVFSDIYMPALPYLFVGSSLGAYLGAHLMHRVHPRHSKRLFGVVLLVAGCVLFLKSF